MPRPRKNRRCDTPDKLTKSLDIEALEKEINDLIDENWDTKQIETLEIHTIGTKLNLHKRSKKFIKGSWEDYADIKFKSLSKSKSQRYMRIARWINKEIMTYMKHVSQRTIVRLIEVMRFQALTPKDLPKFLEQNNVEPNFNHDNNIAGVQYNDMLRGKLQEIKSSQKPPSDSEQPPLVKNEDSTTTDHGPHDGLTHIAEPNSDLCTSIFYHEEWIRNTSREDRAITNDTLLEAMYERYMDTQEILLDYNQKNPSNKFRIYR